MNLREQSVSLISVEASMPDPQGSVSILLNYENYGMGPTGTTSDVQAGQRLAAIGILVKQ